MARNQKADGVICGHIHRAEMKLIDGVQYLNCGDWVESCTALIEDFDGKIKLIHFHENDVLRAGRGPGAHDPGDGRRRKWSEAAGHQVVGRDARRERGQRPRCRAYFASAMKDARPAACRRWSSNIRTTAPSAPPGHRRCWALPGNLREIFPRPAPASTRSSAETPAGRDPQFLRADGRRLYALTTRRRPNPPVVAIGHQFMFEHPGYIRAPGSCGNSY